MWCISEIRRHCNRGRAAYDYSNQQLFGLILIFGAIQYIFWTRHICGFSLAINLRAATNVLILIWATEFGQKATRNRKVERN